MARAKNFLNGWNKQDVFCVAILLIIAIMWAWFLAYLFPPYGNYTGQQALMDREDTAVVLGPFLQTLKSTPAFMREEVAVMRQEGDPAMMAEHWLTAASFIDAFLQVSSAMQP